VGEFTSIGFGCIREQGIIAVLDPNSATMQAQIKTAKAGMKLIDARHGRKARSVIVTTEGLIILSSVSVSTLMHRLNSKGESDGSTDQ
jgi:regulator of extracellular matrix RemA (YlzA/DUF370 family)